MDEAGSEVSEARGVGLFKSDPNLLVKEGSSLMRFSDPNLLVKEDSSLMRFSL